MVTNESIQELARRLALRTRRDVFSTLGDTRMAKDLGNGMDFSELREYTTADDARHIHWPSIMAPGTVTVKQFQEEQDVLDVIAVDISRSMTAAAPKWTLTREIAAILCAVSTLFGNGATVLFFSNHVEYRLTLAAGQRALSIATQALADATAATAATDLAAVFHALKNTQKKKARMFVITDLADHDYMPALTRLAYAHDITICHVFPSLTDELPPYATEVIDAEHNTHTTISPDDHSQIRLKEQAFLQRIRQTILHAGAKYLLFTPDTPPICVFRNA